MTQCCAAVHGLDCGTVFSIGFVTGSAEMLGKSTLTDKNEPHSTGIEENKE
ncbi:hypothetical protein IMSAGC008_00896 [Muribaculaceae bacterium]|nr:hypothetical protein IMSAGC008_00896 [Muribaculaceae bacterium]